MPTERHDSGALLTLHSLVDRQKKMMLSVCLPATIQDVRLLSVHLTSAPTNLWAICHVKHAIGIGGGSHPEGSDIVSLACSDRSL